MASPAPCPPRPRGTGLTPHSSAGRRRLLPPGAGAAGAARPVQAPPGPTASPVRPPVAACPGPSPAPPYASLPPSDPPFPRPSPRYRPFLLGPPSQPQTCVLSLDHCRPLPVCSDVSPSALTGYSFPPSLFCYFFTLALNPISLNPNFSTFSIHPHVGSPLPPRMLFFPF